MASLVSSGTANWFGWRHGGFEPMGMVGMVVSGGREGQRDGERRKKFLLTREN